MLCTTVVHSDTHTHEQFLRDECWFRFRWIFVHFFRFSILCVFWFSLDCFVSCIFCFFVFGLVSSVLREEIGWEEHLRNDLFCIKWDVKP